MATCLNSKGVLRLPGMLNNITLVDVMCPVCRGIFIEPVTLPCQHGLCLKCFERSIQESSLACPMCRKRVGGWLRTAKKDGNLVNIKLWALIQQRFPKEVQAKMNGEDDGVDERVIGNSTPQIRLSTPGEIGQEFAFQLQQLEKERERLREAEWRASCELIQKLHAEEKRKKEEETNQVHKDEEMARELQDAMLQSSSNLSNSMSLENQQVPPEEQQQPEKTPLKLQRIEQPLSYQCQGTSRDPSTQKGTLDYFFQKKATAGQPFASDTPECNSEHARSSSNVSTASQDSITQEMLHFKPIKVVPRTPPKRLPDGQVVEPRLVKATPLNLNRAYEVLESGADVDALLSPASRLRLGLCQPQCALPQPSAFRGYPCVAHGGTSSAAVEEVEVETPTKRPRLAGASSSAAALDAEDSSAEATPSSPSATDADINMGVLRLSPGVPPSGSSQSADLHTKVGFLQIIPTDDPLASSSSSGCCAGAKDTPDSRVSSMDVDTWWALAGPAKGAQGMEVAEWGAARLLAEEQAEAEQRLQQQRADWELAKRLHDEWNLADQRVDRSRGSDNPYELRRKPPSAGAKASDCARGKVARARQRTLDEVLGQRRRSGRN